MALPGVPPVPGSPSSAPAPAPQAASAPPPPPASTQSQPAAPVQAVPSPAPAPVQAAPPPAPAAVSAPAESPAQAAPPTPAPVQAAPPAAPVAAPAAPTPQYVPEAPNTDQQLVAQTSASAPVKYQGIPEASNLNSLAEQDDFFGLSFDSYGVFPVITLNDGEFRSSDGTELGPELYVKLVRSRPKYLYKTDLPDNDPRSEVAYSYDMATVVTNNRPLTEVFEEWAQKGLKPVSQPAVYIEATAQRMDNGQLVLLSIPKNSIGNFSAYWAQMKFSGKNLNQVVTRVHKGRRVERAVKPFVPWAFSEAKEA